MKNKKELILHLTMWQRAFDAGRGAYAGQPVCHPLYLWGAAGHGFKV